jgi:formylglycine-generating enzyme required for sulfatase activity
MGCRLPTEAEWEYACKAGTTTPYNMGNDLDIKQANFDVSQSFSFFNFNSHRHPPRTLPVGSFAPNAWGLYDMHGNVCEWCTDWYGNYPTQTQTNPTGPSLGTYRIIRGGSWHSNAKGCRSACRGNSKPDGLGSNIGFRLVSPY